MKRLTLKDFNGVVLARVNMPDDSVRFCWRPATALDGQPLWIELEIEQLPDDS